MTEVKLYCAVYSEGSVFPVKIARDAEVSTLKKAIFGEKRYKERYSFDASTLKLYLARKNGEWLKDDEHVTTFLLADKSAEYDKLRPSWKLNKPAYFGDFSLEKKRSTY